MIDSAIRITAQEAATRTLWSGPCCLYTTTSKVVKKRRIALRHSTSEGLAGVYVLNGNDVKHMKCDVLNGDDLKTHETRYRFESLVANLCPPPSSLRNRETVNTLQAHSYSMRVGACTTEPYIVSSMLRLAERGDGIAGRSPKATTAVPQHHHPPNCRRGRSSRRPPNCRREASPRHPLRMDIRAARLRHSRLAVSLRCL